MVVGAFCSTSLAVLLIKILLVFALEKAPSDPTFVHIFSRFHLDTETVREIESLGAHDQVPSLETISTKIPIYEFPTRRSPNLEGSKIPSRLPKPSSGSKFKTEAFPDMSDIFAARTEELLHSARSKSGKKRRHTTVVEPRFETPPPPETVTSTAANLKRHPTLKRTESPTNLDQFHGPRSFNLNEVDAGIGSRWVIESLAQLLRSRTVLALLLVRISLA